jgi:two-component system, NtrC family, response regulator AtoC
VSPREANIKALPRRDSLRSPSDNVDPVVTDYAALLSGSQPMRAIKRMIDEIAPTAATVLIRGETGVGKDVVARAVAAASLRTGAFVKLNCAAVPGALLESELFGHEKGAFTGADRRKLGKFEFAHRGTLWLDEIGELPLPLQAKLLHVLQDRAFYRIGGRDLISVDARIIASTNRDLAASIVGGAFREDLYYRLNVVEIFVPPLRERREEIRPLATALFNRFRRRSDQELAPETLALFTEYDWPGNVRELENIVRRIAALGQLAPGPEQLRRTLWTREPERAPGPPQAARASATGADEPSRHERSNAAGPRAPVLAGVGLRDIARAASQDAERRALKQVLDEVRWNRTEAAGILKVSYKTLLSKIAEYKL